MSRLPYSGPTLPKTISDLVGGDGKGKDSRRPQSRTDRRKQERQQKAAARKKASRRITGPPTKPKFEKVATQGRKLPPKQTTVKPGFGEVHQKRDDPTNDDISLDEGFAEASEDASEEESSADEASAISRPSKTVQARLDREEAEIAALERKLGIKKKSKKAGVLDDGLEDLFGELSADDYAEPAPGKRKVAEDEEWLRQKRRKVKADEPAFEGFSDEESLQGDSALEEDAHGIMKTDDSDLDSAIDEDGADAFDSLDDLEDTSDQDPQPVKRARENPYVAPVAQADRQAPAAKYVPPSLRQPASSDQEAIVRLQRKIQGLINRLSDANLLSILQSVEALYQDNPRQHVTSGLISTLLALVADAATLTDQFIVLHGGFIAALYRVLGTDFGAQLLERVVQMLDEASMADDKKSVNLVSLLATLYNFQVISCDIIYDLMRHYINRFSEDDTELLLRVIRTCGPQLRQDDPSALKDVVSMVQKNAAARGSTSLSVRQSFMVETINDLKNNRLRGGMASSASRSEATMRMKKMLGTVKSKSSKAAEPLRVNLDDIRNSDKKGKWWLVGASYRDPAKMAAGDAEEVKHTEMLKDSSSTKLDSGEVDLTDLARRHGMNTDIRRAIFVAIMSAVDYQHAIIQINKLSLKKSQMEEIPLVLIRCVVAENTYNAFYSFVARELCHHRQVKMAFQFALWDQCKRMDDEEEDDDDADQQGKLELNQFVSLAKLYARLIRTEALHITVLKKIDFVYMQPHTRLFLEVLLTTVILDKTKIPSGTPIDELLAAATDAEDMAAGFRYFVETVVARSEVPEKKRHRQKVAEVCNRAAQLLAQAVAT